MEKSEPLVGIAEFGAILRRRWITIAATTTLVSLLGLAFVMAVKPIYSASTSIFVDPRNRASFQIEGTGTGAGFDPNLVDSQSLIIESETVLRRVIDAERLNDDPEFTRGAGDPRINVVRNLKKAIKVKRPDRTYIVEIEVRTEDAEKSARLANAIARAYLSDGRDSKTETATRESNWLDTHIRELQSRLKGAEEEVEKYKIANRILGVDGKLIGEQRLVELNRSIVEAQRKTTEAKAVLEQVEQIRKSGKIPEATADALKSLAIDRLRGQMTDVLRLEANSRSTLGPRHPASIEIREQLAETRRQLNEEINRVAEGAKNAYAVARANESALEKQIEAMKSDTSSTNQTLVRLRELERAVDAQKAVYQKFLSDKEQIARLSVDTPAGRVIAPASVPQTKAFPNKILIMLLSFVGGLLMGVALALALETLAGVRRRPADIAVAGQPPTIQPEHETQKSWQPHPAPHAPTQEIADALAILPGMQTSDNIRWITRNAASKAASPGIALDLVQRKPGDPYALAIMQLQERLGSMIGTEAPVTLLVCGLQSGVGSTTLASNLAWAFAQSGRAVALVDGNPGHVSLSSAARTGDTISVRLLGRELEAQALAGAGATGPFLISYRSPRKGVAARRRKAAPDCAIIVIDGPVIGSKAFSAFSLDKTIDGVIVALPPKLDPADPAMADYLRRQFGEALIGTVARAA